MLYLSILIFCFNTLARSGKGKGKGAGMAPLAPPPLTSLKAVIVTHNNKCVFMKKSASSQNCEASIILFVLATTACML